MSGGNCDYCGNNLTIGYEYVKNLEFRYCSLRCLEDSEAPTVDTSQAHPSVIDMLANLARRVTSLEAQLSATQRNIETWAEQAEIAKHVASKALKSTGCHGEWLIRNAERLEKAEELIEMALGDITMLDERSQVIDAITKLYEERW